MSQNIQLGIAAICGGATFGLTNVAGFNAGLGIALAAMVGGIVLIALTNKPAATEEIVQQAKSKAQKARKEIKKHIPSPQKAKQQLQKVLQKTPKKEQHKEEDEEEDEEEAPETPEKKKKNKKKSKGGSTAVTSPVSSPPPQHAKPKPTPKVEEEPTPSKNAARKQKKKEADEKKKIEDEKQRAAELAKKAVEQKREAAQQKKLQAKARKAAQKGETKPETKVETKQQPVAHEPEDGWERAPARKPRAPKDGKDASSNSNSREPIVIDVKVPPRQHAVIIGRQGEGIKKLSEDLDVIITMPKRDSGNDMILIKGLPKDVYTAKKAIEELATKGYSTVTQPGWTTKQVQLQNKGQVATLVGEKGQTLQSIQKSTGARVQMPERGSDNMEVSITGDEKSVEDALRLIQELTEQGYTKTTHPDWVQEEVQVGSLLGAIIGPKGATVKQISRDFKVRIDTPKREDSSSNSDATVYIRGPKVSVAKAKKRIQEIVASHEPPIEQEIPDPAWQEDVQEVAW